MDIRDADLLTTTTLTLGADALYHEFTAASWPSVAGPLVGPAASQLRGVRIRSVATQAAAMRLGPAGEGLASGGYVARLTIPDSNLVEHLGGQSVTIGNLTVHFRRTGESSGATIIGVAGKTRAQVRTELFALISALSTGIGDLAKAISVASGVIVLQSAANAAAITASTTASRSGLIVEGFLAAGEVLLPTSTTPLEFEVPPGADVRCLSLRAQVAGAVIVIDAYWTTRSV
jgi:hypothetical protein